jgi:hypothetical protein
MVEFEVCFTTVKQQNVHTQSSKTLKAIVTLSKERSLCIRQAQHVYNQLFCNVISLYINYTHTMQIASRHQLNQIMTGLEETTL